MLQIQETLPNVKIIFVGEAAVGKTCIVKNYIEGVFTATDYTIGGAFYTKTIDDEDGKFQLSIWDTAGQEQYRTLIPMYYRNAAIAVIVFDITNQQTFDQVRFWVGDIKKTTQEDNIIYVLCGNKIDLEENRMVSKDDVDQFAQNAKDLFQFVYIETSAKTGTGIDNLFQFIISTIKTKGLAKKIKDPSLVPLVQEKKKCCK
ncbi:small GTP-binding protein [Histomonas meleagridis]|uniref:small GTP-binding protein n=1 Tax=Histomonas meleagridis TaxID=135588 RepID=UPI0035598F42|nr:small GTP-binding protein [Histomonas meleagridis]KAH0799262.1 small GTP-binding protein [Histomonas meleagridis]